MSETTFEVEHQIEIPDGAMLRAVLKKMEVVKREYNDRQTGEVKQFSRLHWIFEITQGGEYLGMTVRGETEAKLTDKPNDKFRTWAEQLLGRELGLGAVLSIGDLEGLGALITVIYESDRKDPSKRYRKVGDVLALDDGGDPWGGVGEPPF